MDNNAILSLTGYDIRHLAWHLAEAGRSAELHCLLTLEMGGHNFWFETKEAVSDPIGFAEDVKVAWNVAVFQAPPTIKSSISPSGGQPVSRNTVELSIRYALYTSSLNTLDYDHYPGLIYLLVTYGIWNLERALACVGRLKDEWNQASLLEKLLPKLPDRLLAAALSLARDINFYRAKAQAIACLASRLPQHERDVVVEEALEAARSHEGEPLFGDALRYLAPLLPKSRLCEALTLAEEIPHVYTRAKVLADLLLRLPYSSRGTHLENILAQVRTEERVDLRAEALAHLSACLSPSEMERVLEEAAEIASSVGEPEGRVTACAALLPHLPDVFKPRVARALLKAIRQGYPSALSGETKQGQPWEQPPTWLVQALDGLGPGFAYITIEDQIEAIGIAAKIENDLERARMLAMLAQRAERHLQKDAFTEALEIMNRIPNDSFGPRIWRYYGASHLRPELSDEQIIAVLLDKAYFDPDLWICDVTFILDGLPANRRTHILMKALASSRRIADEETLAAAVLPMISWLDEKQITEAGLIADHCPDVLLRVKLMVAISYRLPKRRAARMRKRALAIAIDNLPFSVDVLGFLLPHLSQHELHRAFKAILAIESQHQRAEALARCALYVPRNLQRRAVQALCALSKEGYDDSLAALAVHLPDRLRRLASSALIKEFSPGTLRGASLVAFVPMLSESLVKHVSKLVTRTGFHEKHDEVVLALCLRSTELGRVHRALSWMTGIRDDQTRELALDNICSLLAWRGRVREALDVVEKCREDDRVTRIAAIARATDKPFGDEAAARVVRLAEQIREADDRVEALCTILPVLPDSFQHRLLPKVLMFLLSQQQPWRVAELFEGLAMRDVPLAAYISSEILESILCIESEAARTRVIVAIAPYVDPNALGLMVTNTQRMADPYTRASGLASLYFGVRDNVLDQILERTLSEIDQKPDAHRITDLMPMLLPCLPKALRDKLIETAQYAALAVDMHEARDRTLRHLAKTLCNIGLPNKGLTVAALIDDVKIRSEALQSTSSSTTELLTSISLQEWHHSLQVLARRKRKDFFSDLQALWPAIGVLGGRIALANTFESLRCVGRWWP